MKSAIQYSVSVVICANILRMRPKNEAFTVSPLTPVVRTCWNSFWTRSISLIRLEGYLLSLRRTLDAVTDSSGLSYFSSMLADGRFFGFGVKHFFIRSSRSSEYLVCSGMKYWLLIAESLISKGCFLKHNMKIRQPSANMSTFGPISKFE